MARLILVPGPVGVGAVKAPFAEQETKKKTRALTRAGAFRYYGAWYRRALRGEEAISAFRRIIGLERFGVAATGAGENDATTQPQE